MAGLLSAAASLALAGSMLFNGSVNLAAPQHDVDGLLFLVNRDWRVSSDYEPALRMTNVPGQVRRMRPDAAGPLEQMYAAATKELGVTLVDISGYRSYGKQAAIYNRKLKSSGSREMADRWVARPGASEHQLGLAMDVGQRNAKGNLSNAFGKTKGGKWLRENCWRFGFILRYDQGWEKITGYSFEPWHVRYVGKYAREIHQANQPLETWLAAYRESNLLDLVAPTEPIFINE